MGLVTKFTSLQLSTVSLLELKPIASQMLSAVLELDDLCFGGLWTLEGYQRELDSPNSVLLGLFLGDSRGAREFYEKDLGDQEDNYELQIHPSSLTPQRQLLQAGEPVQRTGSSSPLLKVRSSPKKSSVSPTVRLELNCYISLHISNNS